MSHFRAGTRPGDSRERIAGTASIPSIARRRRLTWPARQATRWAVAAERPGTHPQARAQRRRHVVKRRAAVAAELRSGGAGTQPVAAGLTFRIDALNGPARQILHAFLLLGRRATLPAPFTPEWPEKLRGFCGEMLVVSREKIQ
jgi:hypothetical protein